MTDISTRLITADLMLTSGRPEVVRQSLLAIRNDFYKLRKSAGIVVLADCIFDANVAASALMANDTPELDLSKPGIGRTITEQAATYAGVLTRCDAVARRSDAQRWRIPPAYRRGEKRAGESSARGRSARREPDSSHRRVATRGRHPAGIPFRLGSTDPSQSRKHVDQPVGDRRHLSGEYQHAGRQQQRAHDLFNFAQLWAETRTPAHETGSKACGNQKWDANAKRIDQKQRSALHRAVFGAGDEQNGGQHGPHAGAPAKAEREPDEIGAKQAAGLPVTPTRTVRSSSGNRITLRK